MERYSFQDLVFKGQFPAERDEHLVLLGVFFYFDWPTLSIVELISCVYFSSCGTAILGTTWSLAVKLTQL